MRSLAQPTVDPVYITGIGAHTAFGDLSTTWKNLQEGASAVRTIRIPEAPGFPPILAAPAAPYDLTPYLSDRKLRKYMSLATELAVLCAGRALENAHLHKAPSLREKMALYMATGAIAFDLSQAQAAVASVKGAVADLSQLGQETLRACNPLLPFKMLLNMPLGLVSIAFGVKGPNAILYPDAIQGAMALDAALRGIRQERFHRALVGASAQTLSLAPLARASRSAGHATFGTSLPPADQGVFFVLENHLAMTARGAKPIAVIRGNMVFSQALDEPSSRSHAGLWQLATGGQFPRTMVTSGHREIGDDSMEAAFARHLNPDQAPDLLCFDQALGFGDATGFLLSLALACQRISDSSIHAALSGEAGNSQPDRTLVTTFTPQGQGAALLVEAPSSGTSTFGDPEGVLP